MVRELGNFNIAELLSYRVTHSDFVEPSSLCVYASLTLYVQCNRSTAMAAWSKYAAH